MKMPKTISAWCTVLFFLFFGLESLGVLAGSPWSLIVGILALAVAVLTFLGM